MPLSTKDRMDLTSAIQEAKKRRVDKKRNKFSNVLRNPQLTQKPRVKQQKPKKSLSQKVRDKLRILPKIEGKGNKNKLGLKTQEILDNTQRVARRRNKPADRRIRSKSQWSLLKYSKNYYPLKRKDS